jgi:hypothetical protein
VIGLEQVLQSAEFGTFWNMFLLGLGFYGFLLRMKNWKRILH